LFKINGHSPSLDYFDDNVRLAHRGHGELTHPHFRYDAPSRVDEGRDGHRGLSGRCFRLI
jgi:hypothetical protein